MFKSLQVVRVVGPVRDTKGHFITLPVEKVVVIRQDGDKVIARYGTSKADYVRVTGSPKSFAKTLRGRPLGSKTKKVENVTVVESAPVADTPTA